MRKVLTIAGLVLAFGLLGTTAAVTDAWAEEAGTATESAPTLEFPSPDWYTADLHAKVLAAGARGVDVSLETHATELNCLGYSPPYVGTDGVSVNAVSAGGCMVAPSGCTMNFVFTDSTGTKYIGTAGHCAGRGRRL